MEREKKFNPEPEIGVIYQARCTVRPGDPEKGTVGNGLRTAGIYVRSEGDKHVIRVIDKVGNTPADKLYLAERISKSHEEPFFQFNVDDPIEE